MNRDNSQYSEHVTETDGVTVYLYDFRGIEMNVPWLYDILLSPEKYINTLENVDFHESENRGLKTGGDETYAMSLISERDKLTRYVHDCTSVLSFGTSKKTGKTITFLTHQDPYLVLPEAKINKEFENDLIETLREMRDHAIEGSIRVYLLGGIYRSDDSGISRKDILETRDIYRRSILYLSTIIERVFGFEPVVRLGPKDNARSDVILVRTEQRCLHVVRPQTGDVRSESYLPSKITFQESKWQ